MTAQSPNILDQTRIIRRRLETLIRHLDHYTEQSFQLPDTLNSSRRIDSVTQEDMQAFKSIIRNPKFKTTATGSFLLMTGGAGLVSKNMYQTNQITTDSFDTETAPLFEGRLADSPEVQKYEDALSPNEFRSYKLVKKELLTHDTARFVFELRDENGNEKKMNVPTASCILTKTTNENGENVLRPYTPTNSPNSVGHLNLVVKRYPDGKMSSHIHNLQLGDKLEMKGPFVKINYEPNMKKHIGLIVGGSGLTPGYQIVQEVLRHADQDNTKVSMIFANRSPQDIIMKDKLDKLSELYPNQFNVYYSIDQDPNNEAPANVKGRGYVTPEMIREAGFPQPSSQDDDSILIGVCGPPKFMQALSGEKKSKSDQGELTGILKDMGYSEKNVFKF